MKLQPFELCCIVVHVTVVTVSFDESEYRGDEGDTLTVSLVLDGTLGEGRSVQVGVATEELTAASKLNW